MKLRLHSFRIPLRHPLTMLGHRYEERTGLLVSLSDQDTFTGWGEISPMPGLHQETLSMAETALRNEHVRLEAALKDCASISDCLTALDAGFDLYPSLKYGLEMAALNLYSRRSGKPIADLFGKRYLDTVSINGLISIDDDVERSVEEGLRLPVRSLKMKVGHADVESDALRVRRVQSLIPAGVTLRLDANRAWTFQQAVQFAGLIGQLPIEYIEEPLQNSAELPRLYRETGLPIALDESLSQTTPQDAELFDDVAALIIKPGFLGGFSECLQWGRVAESAGAMSVVSCAVQSGIGLLAAANLAALLNDEDIPCGLGTFQWLEEDLTSPAFADLASAMKVDIVETRDWEIRSDMISAMRL